MFLLSEQVFLLQFSVETLVLQDARERSAGGLAVTAVNPVLEGELRKALETLALSHDTQKKAVSIRFVGEGKRKVRVGYVVENPIWKTAYRLVMSQKADENPYLQGWAVVENPTQETDEVGTHPSEDDLHGHMDCPILARLASLSEAMPHRGRRRKDLRPRAPGRAQRADGGRHGRK